jgi:hypothetical protein
LALWAVRCLVRVGGYGSNGLGIPLAVLAAGGAVLMGRRSPARLALLAGPFGFGMAASLAGRYPLDDRLVFFLVPCLWLLAAEALGALARAAGRVCREGRVAWLGTAVLAALLLPGAAQVGKDLVRVTPKVAFREAFLHVNRSRSPEDVCWVSHAEVFEVYHGKARDCLGSLTPAEEVLRRAAGHRLWLVYARSSDSSDFLARLEPGLQQLRLVLLQTQQFPGLVVQLYGPPSGGRG